MESQDKRVDNQIPGKQIPSKNIPSKKQIPSGEPKMLEDKREKEVRTYADVVSAGTATN